MAIGRTHPEESSRFWPQRLLAFELTRRDTQLCADTRPPARPPLQAAWLRVQKCRRLKGGRPRGTASTLTVLYGDAVLAHAGDVLGFRLAAIKRAQPRAEFCRRLAS